MTGKAVYVTQPYLPPLDEFIPYMEAIWDSKWLTNNGPYHQQLEAELCEYLGVEHISLFTNGTIALVTALHSMNISGEVITTPFSFVATAHSLFWNNITPVFVDIDPHTMNMAPAKVEAAITDKTTAILPVHCYGTPCDVEAIKLIADKHNLKVIYDAAHAFGVKYNGESVLKYGDLSVLSFHATKVFNTFEGGAIVCPDAETKQNIDRLKNFGFVDEVTVTDTGINGKMNEVQAAFGVLQLKHIDAAIEKRKIIAEKYTSGLSGVKGVVVPGSPKNTIGNYSYYPVLITDEYPLSRDELYEELKKANIHTRRYFYPLISSMKMYREFESSKEGNLKAANEIASKVLCLPIYPDLEAESVEAVIEIITNG